MNAGEPQLPVAIVAGLHTDARRSAVEEILRTVPGSVALHHDLSAATDRAAWDMVPAERRVAASLDWHPVHGDRRQHLTFTSPGLDRDNLLALLDSCLLTDAEYARGPAGWKHLSHAFDDLLDTVA